MIRLEFAWLCKICDFFSSERYLALSKDSLKLDSQRKKANKKW